MKKVLIVEDDKDFLWILRQTFDHQDFTVLYALDGEEGVAVAQKENPDIIVMDISLPKLDGIGAAKMIHDSGLLAKIIFLTNLKDLSHVSRAMEAAGQTDYIVKSDVPVEVILERVKAKLNE